MGIFGWSYPAGAEHDPNAPYNQDYDDDHCQYCGVNLDNIFPADSAEDETALSEGFCCAKCQTDWDANGCLPADDYGKPQLSIDQKDRLKALHNALYDYTRKPLPEPVTLEEATSQLPDGDFDYPGDEAGDWHAYCCGEKDCPQQWHIIAFATSFKRTNGHLVIDIMDVDESGNWEFNCGWEEGDDWLNSGCAYHFGKQSTDSFFQGWAEYWLDAAETGLDPCNQQGFAIPALGWVDYCLKAAENNIKYIS